MEVLRKRALAGGGGLLHASLAKGVGTEGYPRIAKPPKGTFLLNVLREVKGLFSPFSGRRIPAQDPEVLIGEGTI